VTENIWGQILERLKARIDPDEYRRWFAASAQASDSGDQITVWVMGAAEGRHITTHYLDIINRELEQLQRPGVFVRFVATGWEDEDEDELEE
jgi:chromosomal replication initiation ATPase DnaA